MNILSDEFDLKVFADGPLGHLVLSNARTLNALTLEAIKALAKGVLMHESDPQVKAILISSDSERAFCAGGQMKTLRNLAIKKHFEEIDSFFEHEYALNLAIANCSKPYIALLDSVAMGGGLGISIHGSFRVVTERAKLAMPESRIGFFPDVGASFFLQTLKFQAAYWLGLTAISVNADQSVAIGLASHQISSKDIPKLIDSLHSSLKNKAAGDLSALHESVKLTLNNISHDQNRESTIPPLEKRALWFSDNDLSQIRQRLHSAIDQSDDKGDHGSDAQHLLTLLDAGSPYSATITLDLFKRAKGLTLEECLILERQLASEACRHPDFIEGIRSVLIDKDRCPRWQPTA